MAGIRRFSGRGGAAMRERSVKVAIRLAALSFTVIGGAVAFDAVSPDTAAAAEQPHPGWVQQARDDTKPLPQLVLPATAGRPVVDRVVTLRHRDGKPGHSTRAPHRARSLPPVVHLRQQDQDRKGDRLPLLKRAKSADQGHPVGRPRPASLPAPKVATAIGKQLHRPPIGTAHSRVRPVVQHLAGRLDAVASPILAPVITVVGPRVFPGVPELAPLDLSNVVTILLPAASELSVANPRAGPNTGPITADLAPEERTIDGGARSIAWTPGGRVEELRHEASPITAPAVAPAPSDQSDDDGSFPRETPAQAEAHWFGGVGHSDARPLPALPHRLAQLGVARHGQITADGRRPTPGTRPA